MVDKVDNRRSEAEWTRRELLKLAGAGAAFAALGGAGVGSLARAGWVVPLEDYLPRARTYYAPKVVGYALQDMTYNGKMYGLPYYADITTFQYNAKLLKDKGVAHPPTTWEELTDQAKFLRGKG